jgi:hypothetical protein
LWRNNSWRKQVEANSNTVNIEVQVVHDIRNQIKGYAEQLLGHEILLNKSEDQQHGRRFGMTGDVSTSMEEVSCEYREFKCSLTNL